MQAKINIDNIPLVWVQTWPLLQKAVERQGLFTQDSIRDALLTSRAHLFLQWEGQEIEAAVVSEFVSYPTALMCRIWLMGALPERTVDYAGLREMVVAWARVCECAGLEVVGRHGWSRRFHNARTDAVMMTEWFEEIER